jgi:hypothetical protein
MSMVGVVVSVAPVRSGRRPADLSCQSVEGSRTRHLVHEMEIDEERSGSPSACRTTWAAQTFSASVLAIEMSL